MEERVGETRMEGRLLSTGPYDRTNSTCHRLWGRHYHCANCDQVSSYQGHMLGNPPEFDCPPVEVHNANKVTNE